MSTDPRSSDENTYILDTESAAEMARLIEVDRFTTRGMGGLLAEQSDPSRFHSILDIACGPGGWAIETAFTYPEAEVAGIDVSKTMVDYANARARSQGLFNVSFEVMDATRPLEFSDNTFDFVNGRLLGGFLHKTVWPQIFQEYYRILRPGGVLRITELDNGGLSTSAAFNKLNSLASLAMFRAGYGFSPDGQNLCITPMLGALFQNAGFQHMQSKAHVVDFSAGTDAFIDFYRTDEIFFQLLQPLLIAAGVTTQEEFDATYQQAHSDMLREDFRGLWYLLSVWGEKPL